MKYMGSKRAMLLNGLGSLLDSCAPKHIRFVDLFCGTGVVSGYVAVRFSSLVRAYDLQEYARVLAAARLQKPNRMDPFELAMRWHKRASAWLLQRGDTVHALSSIAPRTGVFDDWRKAILASRAACSGAPVDFPLTRAYGGYYFSPSQAIALDALRATVPGKGGVQALAALVHAASSTAASPGHTAQPFGLSDAQLPHIARAWRLDMWVVALDGLKQQMALVPQRAGIARRRDALCAARDLRERDLAFIDPPYSAVQYSRFYHVLEAVATGHVGQVTGSGRYPPLAQRPQSAFSLVSEAPHAFSELIQRVASSGASAIVTFPADGASNGLSGAAVEEICRSQFRVKRRMVSSVFSTLGGSGPRRSGRRIAQELLLYMEPR